MMLELDKRALVEFAAPRGSGDSPLKAVFHALVRDARPPPLGIAFLTEMERHNMAALASTLIADDALHASQSRAAIEDVLAGYRKRLPLHWREWLLWSHWVYSYSLPPSLAPLLEAIEALITVEGQLQYDALHPNRDHIVHQIGDALTAITLHERASGLRPGYDDADWRQLSGCVRGLDDRERQGVTRAGLALAGMFHDVGYLRYVGASTRQVLAARFSVMAPPPVLDLWDAARVFDGTYLAAILGGTKMAVEVFAHAWALQWHGPLAAFVLASVAQQLRAEGRSSPVLEGSLQIAAAAAFLHELHPVSAKDRSPKRRPQRIVDVVSRLDDLAWPALFRIVDEVQCWGRPYLRPAIAGSTLDYGARQVVIDGDKLRIYGPSAKEVEALEYLRAHTKASAVFHALAIAESVHVPEPAP